MSLDYLDVSKHRDTLASRYTTTTNGFGTLISEGTRFDKLLHDYAEAVHQAKGMGKQNEYPELVPVIVQFSPQRDGESSTHTLNRTLPALSSNGDALVREQIGGTVNEQVTYPLLIPSNDLGKFEKSSEWTVSYTPQGIAESFLQDNYLDPQIFSDEGNPVAREAFFRVLNQSPNLDEGEVMEWKGEPNSNELLASGVQRNEYADKLRTIAGIDIEEDRETVVARGDKAVIEQIPRQEKLRLINAHDVPMDSPQFATEMEMTEAIYEHLGDVRELDDYSEYVEPEAPENE